MMPIVVTIDDKIPVNQGDFDPLYAQFGEDGSVWGPMLEKAMAKYYGSYEAAYQDLSYKALHTMAGAPH